MGNPAHLVCDSDALIQVFITRQRGLLVHLRENYGVQPAITQDVRSEVSVHSRFRAQFAPPLDRSLTSGALVLLETETIARGLAAAGHGRAAIDHLLQEYERTWEQYRLHVDSGEAASYAVAVTFGWPLLSHDNSAPRTLERLGLRVASPVLRFCDLLVFGVKTGQITEDECDSALKRLRSEREYVPFEFSDRRRSMAERLGGFSCRLAEAEPNASVPAPHGARDVLLLSRRHQPSS